MKNDIRQWFSNLGPAVADGWKWLIETLQTNEVIARVFHWTLVLACLCFLLLLYPLIPYLYERGQDIPASILLVIWGIFLAGTIWVLEDILPDQPSYEALALTVGFWVLAVLTVFFNLVFYPNPGGWVAFSLITLIALALSGFSIRGIVKSCRNGGEK